MLGIGVQQVNTRGVGEYFKRVLGVKSPFHNNPVLSTIACVIVIRVGVEFRRFMPLERCQQL